MMRSLRVFRMPIRLEVQTRRTHPGHGDDPGSLEPTDELQKRLQKWSFPSGIEAGDLTADLLCPRL